MLERGHVEARARKKSLISVIQAADSIPSSRKTSTAEPKEGSRRAEGRKEATNVDDLVSDFGLLYVLPTSIVKLQVDFP